MSHRHEARLLRVIEHIHDNPGADLPLDSLADAAILLVETALPGAEVGARVGYTKAKSFSRQYCETYGQSPGGFCRDGVVRTPPIFINKGEKNVFDVTIKNCPARSVVGIAHTGPYTEVSSAFEQAFGLIAAQGDLAQVRGMIGVFYDDPSCVPAAKLRSFAGALMADGYQPAPPLTVKTLPGGDHAVLVVKGPYTTLPSAYEYLYGVWLPSSGRNAAESPSFENYLNSPRDTAPGDLLTEINLPLDPV